MSKTYSIVDLLKDINQSFHGGDKAYHTLPESDDLVSQYLLMYEISGGEDLDDYLQKTRVYIAPLRFGSGMKVKVLEGLYRGNPCVTTTVGAEGLQLIEGETIYVSDDAKDFSEKCISLLENESIWTKMRDNARKIAETEYKWVSLFQKMDKTFKKLF